MRILLLFLLVISAFGAVSESPASCANTTTGTITVHPCTVTITFAGSSATSTEINQIQAVFDSAHRGDTLITPAKDITTCAFNIAGTNWGGPADEYFTWKSEYYDTKFPPAGTRVTRAYSSVSTRVGCNTAGSARHFRIRGRLTRGGAAAVDGVKVLGIAFINAYTAASVSVSGMVEVGENAVFQTITGAATTTPDDTVYTASEADLQVWYFTPASVTLTSVVSGLATTSGAHGLIVGDKVYIAGSSNGAHNAVWTVATIPTSTTFTATSLSGSSTGGTTTEWRVTVKVNGVEVSPSTYTWEPWYGRVTFAVANDPGDDVTLDGTSYNATLPSHQPSRILFRHVIMDGEADLDDRVMVRAVILNAKDSEIYDSHFQGFKNISSDSQAIAGWSSYGPHVINNNYVGGATENIMFGGATNTLGSWQVNNVTFNYNYAPHESYTLYKYHETSTWIRKGTVIRQSAAVNNQYIAANTGTTASTAPTWDTTIGNTTVDGTVNWTRLSTSRHYGFLKNNFELKQAVGFEAKYNYFPVMLNADQGCSINIKVESQTNEGFNPFTKTTDILFANNVIESGFCPFNASTNEGGETDFGTITVDNNLFRYFSASNLAAGEATPCGGLAFMNFAGSQTLQNYFTNNLIDAWQNPGTNCTASTEYNVSLQSSSNWIFRNNIMTRTQNSSRPGFWGVSGSETEGSVAIRVRMQNVTAGAGSSSTPIAAGRWTHNIMSGAPAVKYPNTDTGDTGNTTYIPAQSAIGFRNTTTGNFRLRNDSTYRNGSYNETKNLGPDWSQLPLMENFNVTASDREAIFTWTVTPVIKNIPCVMTFGTRDLLTLHADMDPLTYTLPNIDNNDIHIQRGAYRMIRVGSRVALTPATEYGYRVECGGFAKEGYFTTLATLTSTASHTISFVPTSSGTQTLQYGTTYSRATDAISGGSSPTASCAAGTTCSISFTGNRGQAYHYRVNGGRVGYALVQ